jgi:hypothetical protein
MRVGQKRGIARAEVGVHEVEFHVAAQCGASRESAP